MAVLVSAGAFKRVPGAIRRDEKIAVLKPRRIGLKGFDLLHLADHGAHGAASSAVGLLRSEEHTSELQSLMRSSYAVFCLKKKKKIKQGQTSCQERIETYKAVNMSLLK